MDADDALPGAELEEVARINGLRNRIEWSYQRAEHSVGWSRYPVRSGMVIRRHQESVCCASA